MNSFDIARIRATFIILAQNPEGFAADFYDRLFALGPDLRPLFKADLHGQGRKLVAMLSVVVRELDRLDTLIDAVRTLGHRHAGYGVRLEHYDIVGTALLDTLERRLGPAFVEEARSSWAVAYDTLAVVMMDAVRTPEFA